MKLKQQSEDFQVEELTDVAPGQGDHALYLLEKRGWSTPDALQAIRRRWHIEADRLSYGGLKDRHAHTKQFFSIWKGPRRGLEHHQVIVHYLGQIGQPFTSHAIRANRFNVTIRALTAEQLTLAEQAVNVVRAEGVPNYFDDQRFGSVSLGGEFMAHALVQGRFEDALKLALTAPYEHDRHDEKKVKAVLRKHWGDWRTCKEHLPRSHGRSLVDYLIHHPDDWKGALTRLRPELRGLYLSAYQSHLWNRMLARWLSEHCRPEQLIWVERKLDRVPMHQHLEADQLRELAALQLPLPSARLHLEETEPHKPLIDSILAEEQLELRDLQVKGIRSMFFSKGQRAGLCLPANLEHDSGPDELKPKNRRLTLRFDLPRGAYATLVVKRVTEPVPGG